MFSITKILSGIIYIIKTPLYTVY